MVDLILVKHSWQTRAGSKYPYSGIATKLLQHALQKQRPQLRLWCIPFEKKKPNSVSQSKQLSARWSGTQEGGWTAGFGLLGVDTSVALETSLGVHAVQLFNVVSMGVVAHLIMGAMPRLSHPEVEEAMPSAELPPPTEH